KAARVAARLGQPSPIARPGIEVPFEIAAEARPLITPRKRMDPSLAEWANLTPAVPSSAISEFLLDYWVAAKLLQEEGEFANPITQFEHEWLASVFAGRDEIAESELREKLPVVTDAGRVVRMRTA